MGLNLRVRIASGLNDLVFKFRVEIKNDRIFLFEFPFLM